LSLIRGHSTGDEGVGGFFPMEGHFFVEFAAEAFAAEQKPDLSHPMRHRASFASQQLAG
jgi:hypothetical protein